MLLTIDIGNTQLFAGLFLGDQIVLRFRKSSKSQLTSDEYGLFLRSILRENGFDPDKITAVSMSSVVPDLLYSVQSACMKYLKLRPLILNSSLESSSGKIRTGLKLDVHHPQEVGADRIATAIAAEFLYPQENKLIVDFGTATTFSFVTEKAEWKGGLIAPGFRTSMEALSLNTAQLPQVEIQKPNVLIGRNTIENIQAGLYFGALGLAREVIIRLKQEHQDRPEFKSLRVIATGGFSQLFKEEKLFDHVEPDLVLLGLWRLYDLNKN